MDNALTLGGICFAVVLFLIIVGVPIYVALGVAAVASLYFLKGSASLVVYVSFATLNNFVLTAVPLFILMGEIMLNSGISEKLYRGTSPWLAWAPGGLLHPNIAACALFAAVSGSSPATAATIGSVAIPELEKRSYDTKLALGSLAAGGTLGILIPPSIVLIVYGWMAESSVARLFAGGLLPGIMLSGMFMIYIGIRVIRNPALAPREAFSIRALPPTFLDLWPLIVIMGVVLGGLFGGLFTPTEAAAMGVVIATIIAVVQRRLNWLLLKESLNSAVTITSMVLVIAVAASLIASFLAMAGIPRTLAELTTNAGLSKWLILALIFILYIFLGCFMDGVSAMLMTLPTILPIVTALGFDLIWFGVVLVVLVEMGMLTPPVGINVFVIQAISGKSLYSVFVGSAPFFCVMLLSLVVLTAFPSIITWLPKAMMG